MMPAYNAAATLRRTHDEVLAQQIVDEVIVVDDASQDETVGLARTLPHTRVYVHPENRGYGANQKTCYRLALDAGADIVIMVHPDYQYTPKLIPAMAALIGGGLYQCVLGSRILGGHALRGGMPLWRYVGNRVPDAGREHVLGAKLSEYPHRLPRVLARAAANAAARRELRRLRVRQPDARPGRVAGLRRRRGVVPDALRSPRRRRSTSARSVRYGFGCLATAADVPPGEGGTDRFCAAPAVSAPATGSSRSTSGRAGRTGRRRAPSRRARRRPGAGSRAARACPARVPAGVARVAAASSPRDRP